MSLLFAVGLNKGRSAHVNNGQSRFKFLQVSRYFIVMSSAAEICTQAAHCCLVNWQLDDQASQLVLTKAVPAWGAKFHTSSIYLPGQHLCKLELPLSAAAGTSIPSVL